MMISLQQILSYLNKFNQKFELFSFKLILRGLGIIAILFLAGITVALTYKAYIELLMFLKLSPDSPLVFHKSISYSIAIAVGIATAIQSYQIIWDRLSYWGQCIDNVVIYIFTGKKYFLQETSDLLNNIAKEINKINMKIQENSWERIIRNDFYKNRSNLENYTHEINNKIAAVIDQLRKVIHLLKHNNAKDSINKKNESIAERDLNSLIRQVTDICSYIHDIKSRH